MSSVPFPAHRRRARTVIAAAITITLAAVGCIALTAAPATATSEEQAPAWAALPQPTTLALDGNTWTASDATRIFVLRDQQADVLHEAQRLSSDLLAAGRVSAAPHIVVGDAEQIAAGDIVVRTGEVAGTTSREAYSLVLGDTVTITGVSTAGIFYGTRQILQNLAASGFVPTGTAIGSPVVGERSLHLDMARKAYESGWIESQIRDLAYVGINTLELHFSENEGFRIESDTYPQIASDQALTKDQVRAIIALAKDLHLQVIPSLDMPGHLTRALSFFPQYELKDVTGQPVHGALDITNPDAIAWSRTLIDEYAELFADSTYWNLGADEFVDFEKMYLYPSLQAAAIMKFGVGADGFDLLTDFANQTGAYLEAKGFVPRVWNDGMLRSTKVELDKKIQIAWWTNWSPQMAPLQTALDGGYDLINFNDSQFYYVLGENAGYTYPTSTKLWEKDWKPGVFPTTSDGPQTLTAPYSKQLLGASFAIWSDKPDAQTQQQVADGIRSPLRGMAERSWNDGSTLTLAQFQNLDRAIGRAPGFVHALPEPGSVRVLVAG